LARNTVAVILLTLILTNVVWFIVSDFSGPLIGMVFYAILLYVCVYRKHFQAGIVGGIIGFSIHLLELILIDKTHLNRLGFVCLSLNLVFPIAVVYFSEKAMRNEKNKPA